MIDGALRFQTASWKSCSNKKWMNDKIGSLLKVGLDRIHHWNSEVGHPPKKIARFSSHQIVQIAKPSETKKMERKRIPIKSGARL